MNVRCSDCGLQINPTANTHNCQPIGSTTNFQICPHGDKVEQMKENNGAHCLCPSTGECLHHPIGNHCRLPNCPYSHEVYTSDKCSVCLEKKPEALTPLGELVKAIKDFRQIMAKDRCAGHCKTYQEEIQKLYDFSERISNG